MLKPKVKALGFSKEELQSVAADLADNLDLEDDASDDDVNAEIEKAVDSAVPFLKISQKAASRAIENYKSSHKSVDDDDDDDDDDIIEPTKRRKKTKGDDDDDAMSKFMKTLEGKLDNMQAEITSLKKGKTADERRSRLSKLLKDTGTYGKRTLSSFDRMTFENDDEFEEFISQVEEDIEEINKEREKDGLDALGVPPSTRSPKHKKEEVLNDDDIDALAESYN